jgi:hypothetical protein
MAPSGESAISVEQIAFHWVDRIQHECLLFAIAGLLIGGIDDFVTHE